MIMIRPLILVRNWIWRQMDVFVQGLRVTRKRRQSPAPQRINHSRSRRPRSMMNDMIMCTTLLEGKRANRVDKPTSLDTMPQGHEPHDRRWGIDLHHQQPGRFCWKSVQHQSTDQGHPRTCSGNT